MRLLIEWDEASALRLAEAVWDAGGTVRVLTIPVADGERSQACPSEALVETQGEGA